jgi:hypothetical protein
MPGRIKNQIGSSTETLLTVISSLRKNTGRAKNIGRAKKLRKLEIFRCFLARPVKNRPDS